MVNACPAESDPRDRVHDFVKDPRIRALAGLRTDGLQFLIDLVTGELKKQEPESLTVFVDREVLSDNGIDLARDLQAYFEKTIACGKRCNFLLCDDLPVVNWQSAFGPLEGKDAQVYCFSVACRQIPSCSKLL